MANINFDATTIEPNKPFEVLPPGRYVVQIVASEMRPTKNGDGQYLWLELDVLDGEYQGRKLFERLNLLNKNVNTFEFAQRQLSAVCRATGKMQVQDSEELHFVPFIADVKVVPPKNDYGPTNSCRYSALQQQTSAAAQPHPAPGSNPATAPRSSGSAAGSAPWHRKV